MSKWDLPACIAIVIVGAVVGCIIGHGLTTPRPVDPADVGYLYMGDEGGPYVCIRAAQPTTGWGGSAAARVPGAHDRIALHGHWIWSPMPIVELEENDE